MGTSRLWIQKEAALHALCALDAFMSRSPIYRHQIQHVVAHHILPAFRNPRGYMRLRAARAISRNYMTNVTFQDTTMAQLVDCVLLSLQDRDLPVRMEAAKSFRHLVMYTRTSIVLDTLRPVLAQVLDQFFKIMDEYIGYSDEVILALEQLIDQFCDEMGPYAIQLVLRLTQRYVHTLGHVGMNDDNDEEDKDVVFVDVNVYFCSMMMMIKLGCNYHGFRQQETVSYGCSTYIQI